MPHIIALIIPLIAMASVSNAGAAGCPPGFNSVKGQCEIKTDCPYGQQMQGGECVAALQCTGEDQLLDGFCVKKATSGIPSALFKDTSSSGPVNPVFQSR